MRRWCADIIRLFTESYSHTINLLQNRRKLHVNEQVSEILALRSELDVDASSSIPTSSAHVESDASNPIPDSLDELILTHRESPLAPTNTIIESINAKRLWVSLKPFGWMSVRLTYNC